MNWTEQEHRSRAPLPVTAERSQELDKAKDEALPHVIGEGDRAFDPLRPQPVISPGIYEAEFMMKGEDIIFHFWPYGYQKAIAAGKMKPNFPPAFKVMLDKVFFDTFKQERVESDFDRDMGSWFVKAAGWGQSQFAFELSCKACELLHLSLGGERG